MILVFIDGLYYVANRAAAPESAYLIKICALGLYISKYLQYIKRIWSLSIRTVLHKLHANETQGDYIKPILILNPYPALRAGLRQIMHDAGIITPIVEAGSAIQIQHHDTQDLGLIIIDPNMQDLDPVQFMHTLHQHQNTVPVLFFSYADSAVAISLAVRLGADGFLPAFSDETTIASTIHSMLNGMRCFPRDPLSEQLPEGSAPLSQKELAVLMLLRHGLRNKEIAERLYLSEKTISAHKHHILAKLGISTIAQLINQEILSAASSRQSTPPPRA